jgi:hypothetical protein
MMKNFKILIQTIQNVFSQLLKVQTLLLKILLDVLISSAIETFRITPGF